ncbi:hypothetical protein AB0J84_31410, partial [Micromonospora arborensis]
IYIADCPSAGHDMIALDYRSPGEPTVVHVDQEWNYQITDLAPNFETFQTGLAPGRRPIVSCRSSASVGASAGSRSRIGRSGNTLTIAVPCQRQIRARDLVGHRPLGRVAGAFSPGQH